MKGVALVLLGLVSVADAKPRAKKKPKPAPTKPVEAEPAEPEAEPEPEARSKAKDADEVTVDDAKDDGGGEASSDDSDDEDQPRKLTRKAKGGDDDDKLEKQDLSGKALGTTKRENVFERDRFFVDKTDSSKTEKGTLVQGSLTSTSFGYHESGGAVEPADTMVPSASNFNRLFTELRLQTDFRHIGNSRWDARVDVRGRVTVDPGQNTDPAQYTPAQPTRSQSGFLGKNELEIKEAWLVRNGVRSDVFLGRQFVPDLGGVKLDGLRIDYASSEKFTLLGFGGLYPIRGSRSITDDYTPLLSEPTTDGTRTDAGRFTGTGGFGAAYRTLNAYGSFGGVVIAPLSSEDPRIYATSSGYWRYGSKLDFYHFAILDVVGSNAVNAGLTNLSLGLNYKPDQRLRATLSVNRVDTETLNVQAQAFLLDPERNINIIQNEAYLQRIATNEARASLSAGLGSMQRFELTAAATFRYRGEVTLSAPNQLDAMGNPADTAKLTLAAAQSAEVYGSITDRRSVADLRLGADISKIFRVGDATFQRTQATTLRLFAGRELANGHGEWEAEAAYSSNKDDNVGVACTNADLATACYGVTESTVISVGGNFYYRINRDWFLLGSLFLNRIALTRTEAVGMSVDDPTVTGLSGYFRIALRF